MIDRPAAPSEDGARCEALAEELMSRGLLLAAIAAILGYETWSFFVASRYQSLCQLSYWSATQEQLRACDEMRTALPQH